MPAGYNYGAKLRELRRQDFHLQAWQLVSLHHTRPNKEHELLLHQLGMTLPQQPAPRICA